MTTNTINTTGQLKQPDFVNNATSTIKLITWLEQQLARGQSFSLCYRDSAFEVYNDDNHGRLQYVDEGISMEQELKNWAEERGLFRNWLIASGGVNYGDCGEIIFKPYSEELAKTKPSVGTWPSCWWKATNNSG